jgi:hypothetical protein
VSLAKPVRVEFRANSSHHRACWSRSSWWSAHRSSRFRLGHGGITAPTLYGPELGRPSSQPTFIRRMSATPQPIVTASKSEMSSCFDFLSGINEGEAAMMPSMIAGSPARSFRSRPGSERCW